MSTVVIIGLCVALLFFIGISSKNFTEAKKNIKKTYSHYLNLKELNFIINMFPLGIGRDNRFNQYLKFIDPITKIFVEKLLCKKIENPKDLEHLDQIISDLTYFKNNDKNLPIPKDNKLPYDYVSETITFFESGNFTSSNLLGNNFKFFPIIYKSIFNTKEYSPKHPLSNKELQEIKLILDDENNIKILLSSRHYKEKIFQKHISPIAPNFKKDWSLVKSWGFSAKSEHNKALENERKKYFKNIKNLIKESEISPLKTEVLKAVIKSERFYLDLIIRDARG